MRSDAFAPEFHRVPHDLVGHGADLRVDVHDAVTELFLHMLDLLDDERKVVEFMAQGLENRAIAAEARYRRENRTQSCLSHFRQARCPQPRCACGTSRKSALASTKSALC
jgi:hypothetical protein